MTGPSTPGQEGPTYAPPPLPEGWIAQWDGMSRKYYFVQLSTGASQWETPTHPAATGPTPQATPQEGLEHPYGTPGQGHGGYDENAGQGGDGERGIGQFAVNQLLGGNKKQNQGGLGQLGGLATQFLGGGHSNQQPNHSNNGAAGIVGALAGNLLGGGKKPQQQNYSGAQNNHQQSGGGLMGSLGGIFGGHQNSQQGGNFGYSQQHNQQGGYSGSAPPTSYQPSGASNPQYNAPPQQHSYQSPPPAQSYASQQTTYGAPPNQQPTYGASPNQQQPVYGTHPGQQQPMYGGQQAPYSGATAQQSPYGGIQHQDSYGGGAPPQASYPPQGGYPQGAIYGQQPPNSGNLQQPQHQHFQGLHNAEHSGGLYGNAGGAPNVPTNTHPHHGQHQGW